MEDEKTEDKKKFEAMTLEELWDYIDEHGIQIHDPSS